MYLFHSHHEHHTNQLQSNICSVGNVESILFHDLFVSEVSGSKESKLCARAWHRSASLVLGLFGISSLFTRWE